MTGYSQAWIYAVLRNYNQQGPEALGDQRQHNSDHGQVLLDNETQALLYQALQAATEAEQQVWGKNLHTQLETLKTAHPDAVVQLWAMDEHRLGLHPILRRVWVDKWCGSLSVPVHCCYDWFWLYGFVHPRSGQTYSGWDAFG